MKHNKVKISVIIILITCVIMSLILAPISKMKEFALSNVHTAETKARFAPNGKIYTGYCKFDLTRPIIYSIFNEEENKQYVIYSSINRESILSQNWNYNYQDNAIGGTLFYNRDFESVIEFYKNNSCETIRAIRGNDEIEYYPPASPEEIQSNKERDQQIVETQNANQQEQDRYNSLSPEEKIKDNDSKIKLYSEAVNQLNQGIVVYVDGTPIDSGDFNVYDKVERGYVVEYYQEYITQLEEKNRELRDG